jgi:hypothetical protein
MIIKKQLLLALFFALFMPPPKLYCQLGGGLGGALIEGSKYPELIPDLVAYRFVLLSLSLPDHPNRTDLLKRDLRLKRLGLAPNDESTLKLVLEHFSMAYARWRSAFQATDGAVAISDRDEIVNAHVFLIQEQLSSAGESRFKQYVQGEKVKMYVPR